MKKNTNQNEIGSAFISLGELIEELHSFRNVMHELNGAYNSCRKHGNETAIADLDRAAKAMLDAMDNALHCGRPGM